ncbi:hypothetical protein [Methanobacterium formicicum]|nr:hypothetical protein [Methanobacterium formicicum]
MKAKKLKIHVKTSKFSIPIPALRFSTLRWISKMAFKYGPSKIRNGKMKSGKPGMDAILENLTPQDIEMILEHLEQEEPFELVNIDTWDENKEKVRVKIYTV